MDSQSRSEPPPPLPSQDELPYLHSIPGSAALLEKCEDCIESATADLEVARNLVSGEFGLSVDSPILDASYRRAPTLTSVTAATVGAPGGASSGSAALSTTGGYSNVDHIVQRTGDPRSDRIAELKRSLKRRARAAMPENRGEDRWDMPRTPGSRRRRIHRDRDLPSAPPEPPPSGYVAFVTQMTSKVRHDRRDVRHDQTRVVKELSQIWKAGMSAEEREYYVRFAREAQEEYRRLHREYRATGHYRQSRAKFVKLGDGQGPWVRKDAEQRNALEREIASYDTVVFPPRPPTVETPAWQKEREEAARRKKGRESTSSGDES